MKRLITWGGATVVGAVGAAAAFFLDPKSGARRRHVAVEKGATIAPRARAQVSAMVAGATGPGKKKAKPSSRRKASPFDNDALLVEAVRGALAVEHAGVAAAVGVRVRSGRVTLRGEVPEIELIGRVARTIKDVDGVVEVNNLLRLERVS